MDTASAPFRVSVVNTGHGFAAHKDILTFLVSVLSLISTISINFLLWRYGRQQDRQQRHRETQQRQQGHVTQLSDAGGAAMEVIRSFEEDCKSLDRDYYDVYKHRQEVPGSAGSAVAITREQLQQVDAAKSRLQGIWDNIMDDYKADLLGGTITDRQHRRMLNRGVSYMELVEPLSAATFARMQSLSARVGAEEPYVLPDTIGISGTDSQQGSSQSNATFDVIMPRDGARPDRFRSACVPVA
jgi:hypothetical protein